MDTPDTMTVITSRPTSRDDFISLITRADEIWPNCTELVIRFTASWCGPCKKIKPVIDEVIGSLRTDVYFVEIDIDVSHDIYAYLKSKRVIAGVPSLFRYSFPRIESDPRLVHIPDDSVVGADQRKVISFFNKLCVE